MKTIEEENKVIAEFMNFTYHTKNYPVPYWWDGIEKRTTLEFHTSWDWLMPVVEKVEEMGYSVKIIGTYGTREGWCKINGIGKGDFTCDVKKDLKIQAVREAIYQFIIQQKGN